MDEATTDLLERIALGEDSLLGLESVEFSGNKVDAIGSQRNFIMDKRGEGVPIIITESLKSSGKRPEYDVLDDAEVKLTIFATEPPSIED